jgi:myo-inositol-1-phosphate synthase
VRRGRLGEKKGAMILAVGAKGAVGSTVAALVAALQEEGERSSQCLTTRGCLAGLMETGAIAFGGWDTKPHSLEDALERQGVIPREIWSRYRGLLEKMEVFSEPKGTTLGEKTEMIQEDILEASSRYPWAVPVVVDLLPAFGRGTWPEFGSLEELMSMRSDSLMPDLPYALAATRMGIPFVNFTSNPVEHDLLVREALAKGAPMAGRDGKTGQTYLKVVIASALKARSLLVEGWYSLNILGNDDGRNLSREDIASCKLENKTRVLEEVLGYSLGDRHRVRIDFYEPRGDCKEAWDVIDFSGAFGLPMSMRVNLMARDSVLAAPMVIDLARWMVALKQVGEKGLIGDLAFFFKRPLGESPPATFHEQLLALDRLAMMIHERRKGHEGHFSPN